MTPLINGGKMLHNPTTEEFLKFLKDSYEYCSEADDQGSIDFEMSRWQEYISTWKPILDEYGGI